MTIQIKMESDDIVEVPVHKQIGVLALHRTYDPMKIGYPKWTITHVPTGFVALRGDEPKLTMLKALADFAKEDWTEVTSPESKEALKKLGPIQKEIIERYSL